MPTENGDALPRMRLGRYRLVGFLGQGELSVMHLAVDGDASPKVVVVKELRPDLTRNAKFVKTFLAEVGLAAVLNHPNVVRTLEVGQDGDRLFLAMEFLDGQPLSKVLARDERAPRLPLAARIRLLCDALSGLEFAHQLCDYDGAGLGVVHGDISPQNLFVTYDGTVKVADFGIAKAAMHDAAARPGGFKGNLAYASPEFVRGQPTDRRSDVFSVGVMLWEAIGLRRFAPGAPTRASIERRMVGGEPRISQVVPDVEPLLAEICDRAINVDPAARYSSAEKFRQALQTFLVVTGESVDALTIGQAVRAKFADESAEMRRVIDAHLRRETIPDTALQDIVNLAEPEISDDAPTTIADLTEYIEASQPASNDAEAPRSRPPARETSPTLPSVPTPDAPRQRVSSLPAPGLLGGHVVNSALHTSNRTRLWGIAGGVALAGFIYLGVRQHPASSGSASMPTEPPNAKAAVAELVTSPPETAPLPAPTETVATSTPVFAISDIPADAPEHRDAPSSAHVRRASAAAAVTASRGRAPRQIAARAPVSGASATRAPVPREATAPREDMGTDLRQQSSQHQARPIDQTNPFR